MDLGRYLYQTGPSCLDYVFFSDGPKGRIKKVVRFQPGNVEDVYYFNLAFGDVREGGHLNDLVKTNIADAEKVLATVINFTNQVPDALMYVEGSTASRTRKYQMGISKFWNMTTLIFEIYEILEGKLLEPYPKDVNYIGFWAKRKTSKSRV